VGENSAILLDIKIGLPCTHLLMEIIYEIEPGKVNGPCYTVPVINNWFMLLAVHYRVMEHAGSLEST